MASRIIPVIMCGGAGTRLWPASRESMPKQFIAMFAERSTFQDTMLRVANNDLFDKPIVVTSAEFRFVVADQLQQVGVCADIVLEPFRRDSALAVAVATVLGFRRSPDAVLLVLASDHAIKNVSAFHDACSDALPAATEGYIVTFGVIPTEPATGYGYLKPGLALNNGPVRKLAMFAEKPTRDMAETYIADGYLWNSGNFLFQADVMMREITRFQPEIGAAAEAAVDGAVQDLDFTRLAKAPFEAAPKISIDYAVMEKTEHSAVLPVDFGWSDLGSWDAIWAHADQDAAGNALSGRCEVVDVNNAIIHSDDSILTTVIGLNDIVVIASADAVMVAPRGITGEIKVLVEKLKAAGRSEATQHRRIYRPWGYYETLNLGGRHQVKRILVKPGQQLSLQKHFHRSEHWVVVHGTGEITVGDEVRMLHENESTYIPIGAIHRLANPGRIPLELIEVQVGSYLGENDIVRLEDAYNRVE
ncbi:MULTISPECIES: mannose-1-phosphate guanylyltransferase/mannose-6-phosphate isomerase [Rhodopseudomonas]|nr:MULTISPECIES: mannose-1-phosphate guanylyltransferase/mannose-6-phosphate isomerase [Rhodopseudomonas]MDF3810003.1 mannose-1-phosphate guanylyltransferase/mannose-6-phosphate isomerase [Rhodopseudomonas sp. BAL398]WOK20439.1 mannose-1-phosphate guanylyltransferase/mannose-6-phosphate isomerase [Rhodopseudomonas sp. BAL398]